MSIGPTEEGSIVGRLKLDSSAWNAELSRAEAKADELGRKNPTIRVNSEVADAIAKLKAAQSAADQTGNAQSRAATQLAVAQLRLRSTTESAALAMRRLDAAVKSGAMSDEKLAILAEHASQAQSSQARSALLLAEAENAAAAATGRGTAQNVENAASSNKAATANKGNVTRMGLIVAAVAALIAMGAPLVGFALGVSGALVGMGAAGVLAFLGIRREMNLGTDAGNTFAAGLQGLLGGLHQLEATAAVGILKAFSVAISTIDSALPSLNTQIGLFTTLLGSGANITLKGVLTLFQVLNPLFVTAAVYVNQLAAGFLSWTSNGGLQKFAAYAMSVLPVVEQTLGALAKGSLDLIGALAPLGVVMLGALTIVGNLVSFLTAALGPAFAPVVAAVLTVLGAFKLWGAIVPIIESVQVAVRLFGVATLTAFGVIGLVVAALGYLAAAWAGSAAAADQATKGTRSYTAALQEDNGVIGENVRQQAAKALADSGAIANGRLLGLTAKQVMGATMRQRAETEAVAAATKKADSAYQAARQSLGRYAGQIGQLHPQQAAAKKSADEMNAAIREQSGGIRDAITVYNDLASAQGLTTISSETQLKAVQDTADAWGVSVPTYVAAISAQKKAADQFEQTTADMVAQNKAGDLLKQTLDLLNGKTLTAAQAQNAFDTQMANMSFHITKTGSAVKRASDELMGNSAASAANRSEIISLSAAADANAQAFRNNGGAAADTMQKLIDMKKAIVDNAVAHGEDRDQVQQFIDTIYKIPASIPATKIELDIADAMAKIATLNAALAAVPAAARTSVGVNLANVPNQAQIRWSTPNRPGHAGGGTITGPGSGTSDSVPMWWGSSGEEVIRTAAASYNRPFLKAYNSNPQRALQSVAATGLTRTIINKWYISQTDISGAVTEFVRRQQGGAA